MKKYKLNATSLALIAFAATFGFTNIPLNYGTLGLSAIFWWIAICGIFFIPIVIIMGELAVINKGKTGAIYSWVECGLNAKWAYYAAWSYFIATLFYLPMVAGRIPTYTSYALYGTNMTSSQSVTMATIATILVVLLATIVCIIGPKLFERLGSLAGKVALIVAGIFIVGAIAAPFITGKSPETMISVSAMMPDLSNLGFLTTFSWLIFAIGGAEAIGPMITETENPERNFPRGIILAALLIGGCYIAGTLGLAIISNGEVFADLEASGLTTNDVIFVAYDLLAQFYGWGVYFVQLMGIAYTFITVIALIIVCNVNIETMFSSIPKGYLPNWLLKKNKNNINVNALWFQFGLVSLFVILMSSNGDAADLFYSLYDMSTIAFLLPYLFLGIAFIAYIKKNPNFSGIVIKSPKVAMLFGWIITSIVVIALIFCAYDPTIPFNESIPTIILYYGGLLLFMSIGWILLKLNKNR